MFVSGPDTYFEVFVLAPITVHATNDCCADFSAQGAPHDVVRAVDLAGSMSCAVLYEGDGGGE